MPGTLKRTDDGSFALVLKGLSSDEFNDCLSKVRAITGRKWNPKLKRWEFPADVLVIQRLVQSLNPVLAGDAREWMDKELRSRAEDLATTVPPDGTLPSLPGASALYPYQRAGASFLVEHEHAILADDMGLGKTVQAIAAVLEHGLRNEADLAHSYKLIVCPNSLKFNWKREIQFWVPILMGADPALLEAEDLDLLVPVVVIEGGKAKREKLLREAPKNAWLIVNYEKMRILPQLEKLKPYVVIADEAHRCKNRKAQQTKALWRLRAPLQFALTGTPIMNQPDEIWSILKWLHPKQYTSYWRFFENYVDYYEGYFGRVITGVRNPDHLRFELSNKMARRTKSQVLDLPPKTHVTIPVELSPKQRKLYEEIEENFWVEIETAAASGDETAKRILDAVASGTSLVSIPNAAARCTRLRQAATSPALLGALDDESAKLDAAMELISDGPSDKQWVVFCHFKGSARLLQERLMKQKVAVAQITGEVEPSARQERVRLFQEGTIRVLICTIAAGGVGITLTSADSCIFIERDWVPANNDQAEDRLHRIGQKSNVTIYNIEAINTVDTERISPTNRRKRAMVESVIASSA